MADEIRTFAGVTYTNGNHVLNFPQVTKLITQSTAGGSSVTQTIGTSEEDIALGDIAPGVVMLRNLDATNYVQIGPKSAGVMVAMMKISAGQTAGPFVLDSAVTLRAIANTASVKLQIYALNS